MIEVWRYWDAVAAAAALLLLARVWRWVMDVAPHADQPSMPGLVEEIDAVLGAAGIGQDEASP